MSVEIERKFVVISDEWRDAAGPGRALRQAYVSHQEHASVRVRMAGDRAWLTLKSGRDGIARHEFEYEIPSADAQDMLGRICAGPLVEKTRYRVPHGGRIWEVDVYAGPAEGLVLAEIELLSPVERLNLPPWIGAEVTGDPRFRNSALAVRPLEALGV